MNSVVQRTLARGRVRPVFLSLAVLLLACSSSVAGDDWLPVSPDELRMTSEPKAPGAPAIYLFRQVNRDDNGDGWEEDYVRVKILTEEGRDQANIEVAFVKGREKIRNLKARVIHPDGSVHNFDGTIFEKTVVKAKGLKYLAKTFTLPDVTVGSIIEYRYTMQFGEDYVWDSHWTLSSDLFTKRAKFSLKTYTQASVKWSLPAGLPRGATPPKADGNTVTLEIQDVPAFQTEDFMPPEGQLKYRVNFIYSSGMAPTDQTKYWKEIGVNLNRAFEDFANKRKAMEQAVATIISPSDPPEAKLQKIYARVQQVRNLAFERQKTEKEQKREKQKTGNNVEEVWKLGVADGHQINWLFVALARAAGFECYPVLVSTRDEYFFNPAMMNVSQLNNSVVLVKLNGADLYLDPGSRYAPYGLLPWHETGVRGLRLDKEGGAWVTTSLPESSVSRVERKADFNLDPEGNLDGKVKLVFSGLEALRLRTEERNEDDTARKTMLENMVKEAIPVSSEVELTNQPDWQNATQAMEAQYHVRVAGWVSRAGRRAFVPLGVFGLPEKHVFEHAERHFPIYFDFPYQKVDDITIALPSGWKVDSPPEPVSLDLKGVEYAHRAENQSGALHVTRKLRLDLTLVDVKHYDGLRHFFQTVRTGDEQQAVLAVSE